MRYNVDRNRVNAFLLEQGLTEAEINILSIQFVHSGVQFGLSDRTRASYRPYTRTINIYTHANLPAQVMNRSFLHELRHHIQVVRHTIDLEWLNLPYRERPHEIDARLFADQHKNVVLIF